MKRDSNFLSLAPTSFGLGMRALVVAGAAAALAFGLLASGWIGSASAQEAPACAVWNLGDLGTGPDAELAANGRWTTYGCESRYRSGSDARIYRFRVVEDRRIRIDLASADADSFLYLMDRNGRRLADNDDGGAGLDSRIERELAAGTYVLEATTVGGRSRGPADFRLTIRPAPDCDPIYLGSLEPGSDLTATGTWSLDTCGSRFVVEHPAHGYVFDLPRGGRVRVDLMSESGDPVLSLASASTGLIAANDDGGEWRNSRIERYLLPGTYVLEATTYLERDYQPLRADFTLVVHLVDERVDLSTFLLKIEEVHTPQYVVAGQPFVVHYRAGNVGGGDLADVGGRARLYVVGPRVYQPSGSIPASAGRWQAGVSYHTGAPTASATSVAIDEVAPFEVAMRRPGPSWIFVAVITYDEDGNELGFQGLWHNLSVLSGTVFDEVKVSVHGEDYRVAAEADADGMVETTVSLASDPEAEVEPRERARAVYAAGVHTQVLEGIFERPAVADLPASGAPSPVGVESPSSSALLELLADRYTGAIRSSGLSYALAANEVLSPAAVEDVVLGLAQSAAAEYAFLSTSWSVLQARVSGGPLSFADALAFHSEFAYAERVIAPAVAAGRAVEAARAADLGWQDAGVQEILDNLAGQASCRNPLGALRGVLSGRGTVGLDRMMSLEAEMRVALPAYGLATDAALCSVTGTDDDVSLFLDGLAIDDRGQLHESLDEARIAVEPAPPMPHSLRIVVRLGEDGRIEHGVQISGGERILPTRRYVSPGAPAGQWRVSSGVEVDGAIIGKIRSRRLDDGRLELGFLDAAGGPITPDIRYLPAGIQTGVWLSSAEIEVQAAPAQE